MIETIIVNLYAGCNLVLRTQIRRDCSLETLMQIFKHYIRPHPKNSSLPVSAAEYELE